MDDKKPDPETATTPAAPEAPASEAPQGPQPFPHPAELFAAIQRIAQPDLPHPEREELAARLTVSFQKMIGGTQQIMQASASNARLLAALVSSISKPQLFRSKDGLLQAHRVRITREAIGALDQNGRLEIIADPKSRSIMVAWVEPAGRIIIPPPGGPLPGPLPGQRVGA